ncbi:MAG: septum formation family protein [Acidimicrobiales bacterium]
MAVAGLALALGACGGSDAADEPAESAEETATTVAEEETATTVAEEETTTTVAVEEVEVFQVNVGDCLADSELEGALVSDVEIVSCDAPHRYEVYYAFELPDGDFPGSDAVGAEADKGCYDAFEGFVGLEYESSIYGYTYLQPTADSWSQLGDREVQCMVSDFEGGLLTGSAAGTGI